MKFDQLKRRELIALLGGAAVAWPLAARAPMNGINAPQRPDCVVGHVRLELRNVVANYPFERSHRFLLIQPNCGRRDYSRSSCDGGRRSSGLQHAEAVRSWKLHWAWPRDGKRETLEGAGIPLMQQYRDAGLDMMFDFAQFDDGTVSVEAGLMEMVGRMRGGRLKVFRGQNDAWLEEYRLYHRDVDGRVVKENDDAISASRYGIMMRRFGRAGDWDFHRPINYPKIGLA